MNLVNAARAGEAVKKTRKAVETVSPRILENV